MSEELDLLGQIWVEIINLDPKGSWTAECVKSLKGQGKPFSNVPRVLARLLKQGASPEDLGRVAREHRFTVCLEVLYAADDPGLKDDQAKGLAEVFAGAVSGKLKGRIREQPFIASLLESVGVPDSSAASAEEETQETRRGSDKPFADADTAMERLRQHGKPADIELLNAWHRYDAILKLLRLLDREGLSMSEVAGLQAELLSAEPTGQDARPGSWPVPAGKTPPPGPTAPAFILKSASDFEFSPAEPGFLAKGHGSPPRMYDATGTERFVFEVKRPRMCSFAPEGKRIFFAAENTITSCDTQTGKRLATVRLEISNGYIARLDAAPGGEELLVEKIVHASTIPGWPKHSAILLDAATLKPSRPLPDLFPATLWWDFEFLFSPQGTSLGALWRDNLNSNEILKLHFTEWSWPGLKVERDLELPLGSTDNPLWLPKRNGILLNRERKFVQLSLDTGTLQPLADAPDNHTCYAVSPDESKLLSGTLEHGKLTLQDLKTGTVLRQWDSGVRGHHKVGFSSDGETIGCASERKCQFWRLGSLLQ